MANWQLHKGKYIESYMQIEYRQFKKLERQANLGNQIDKLPHELKQKVLRILEVLLEEEDEEV